jgi:hypothetical protein
MPARLARIKARRMQMRSDLVGADSSPVARRLCRLWATDQIGNFHQAGRSDAGQLDLRTCPTCGSERYLDSAACE